MSITQSIKNFALSTLHVDLCGIVPASPDLEGISYLKKFITENRHGEMKYLENIDLRSNPAHLLPNARSIIILGINYYQKKEKTPPDEGRIARYAYGRDYHKTIKKILKKLMEFILEIAPSATFKPCVDSVPILEKSYAQKAGLGFIGKNTTLINPQIGSFFFLAELITDLELDYDQSLNIANLGCGSCTRCLDACPTSALKGPFQMDANLCISYLTIEKSGEIKPDLAAKMSNLIFGCDICQEVCPYNLTHAKPFKIDALKGVKIAGHSISLQQILSLKTREDFLENFAGSPLMRAGLENLQRNAKIALQNNEKNNASIEAKKKF